MKSSYKGDPEKGYNQVYKLKCKIDYQLQVNVVNIVYPLNIETSTLQVWIDHFNHNVRKLGHVTEYLILGFFVANAYKKSGVRGCKLLLYSFILCFTYAVSDELHQYFVPGRGPGWGDVLIDSAGAILGIRGTMYG